MPEPSKADRAIIAEARTRWTRCDDAEHAQRAAILLAKQFRAGDQWPDEIKRQRQGAHAIAGIPAQPPRPCLVVDRLSQPVRQISNVIKNASFGFDVLPNGAGAETETAEIYKGYMRRVLAQSRGESPVEWAADSAIEGGLGWFRLRADYVHQSWDGDPNDPAVFDQELVLERITNNLSVYCDPSALKPTRSDAQFMFVTEDLDKDEFRRRWPTADMADLNAFMATGDMQGWVGEHTIRIAEYWRITYENRRFELGEDGTVTEVRKPQKPKPSTDSDSERPDEASDSQADDQPSDLTPQTRIMRVPKVEGFKITACGVLERWAWAGLRIPIFPILGEELNIDGKPKLRGIIEEGMDAQRMINYTYSGAMEIFALAPKSPFVAAAGQVESYKDLWQTANTYNHAYLPYDPMSIAGVAVPPPERNQSEPPIGAAVQLMRTSEEAVKATTATGDASLGNSNPNERSGKALQALQQQSELANSNYPDNVRRALIACGNEMVVVIPKISRKGQILHLMGQDDEPAQALAGQPYTEGPNGEPIPSPVSPEAAKLSKGLIKFYDLNQGKYAVTVAVNKATATRREEGASMLAQLIPGLPPAMQAILTPELIENINMPNAQKMAELARRALPPELREPDKDAPPIPPEVQQKMQQLEQALQQATQQLQTDGAKQMGAIETAKIDGQIRLQEAQLKGELEITLQQMRNAASIEVARIGAAKELMNTQAEAQEERIATGQQLEHEVGLTLLEQQHAKEMAELGHSQGMEATKQQVALQPPPDQAGA